MRYLNSGTACLFPSVEGGFCHDRSEFAPHLGACRTGWQLPELASYLSVSLQRRDSSLPGVAPGRGCFSCLALGGGHLETCLPSLGFDSWSERLTAPLPRGRLEWREDVTQPNWPKNLRIIYTFDFLLMIEAKEHIAPPIHPITNKKPNKKYKTTTKKYLKRRYKL